MSKHCPPKYGASRFHCLHCHTYAHQTWSDMYIHELCQRTLYDNKDDPFKYNNVHIGDDSVKVSLCSHCEAPTLWTAEKIIYPLTGMFPPANNDLPDNVKAVYDEASAIANQSPRAAAALLRLALQVLLEHIGRTGNLNTNIKKLVKEGLDPQIQQALDIVRVTGNNAVHPGEIIFDDPTNVHTLFQLINVIANTLITQPKQTQELYDNLPEDARKAIEKRDSKTQ